MAAIPKLTRKELYDMTSLELYKLDSELTRLQDKIKALDNLHLLHLISSYEPLIRTGNTLQAHKTPSNSRLQR